MDELRLTKEEWHRNQAVDNFNAVWDLLDKKERSKEEDLLMIHRAHASRFHWNEIGTPVNMARGEWQISRVYSTLKMPSSALYHAERSLEFCEKNQIGDFDLAFAYEAMARAYMVSGDIDKMNESLDLGIEASSKIMKAEDKNYFLDELKTITL